jgi:hypothetical protein
VTAATLTGSADRTLAMDVTPEVLAADDASGRLYVAVHVAQGVGIAELSE